jgi:hypothetical protein
MSLRTMPPPSRQGLQLWEWSLDTIIPDPALITVRSPRLFCAPASPAFPPFASVATFVSPPCSGAAATVGKSRRPLIPALLPDRTRLPAHPLPSHSLSTFLSASILRLHPCLLPSRRSRLHSVRNRCGREKIAGTTDPGPPTRSNPPASSSTSPSLPLLIHSRNDLHPLLQHHCHHLHSFYLLSRSGSRPIDRDRSACRGTEIWISGTFPTNPQPQSE